MQTENKQIQQIYQLAAKKALSHAILLESDNNEFCLKTAMNVSKILMCKGEENYACEKCDSCLKISKKIHPDINIITPEHGNKTVGVDIIRTIKQYLYIAPNESDYKIYIFPDASLITSKAQNAFLKILEEPPKNVIFILICSSKSLLLKTVLSRLTCFKIYSGSQTFDNDISSTVKEFLNNMYKKNELLLLKYASKFIKNRTAFIKFIKCLKDTIIQDYQSNKDVNDNNKVVKILELLSECEDLAGNNINMSLLTCLLCSKLIFILEK